MRPAPSRVRSLAPIAVFDIAGPPMVYQLLRGSGRGEVTALVISSLPVFGVLLTIGAIDTARGQQTERKATLRLSGRPGS